MNAAPGRRGRSDEHPSFFLYPKTSLSGELRPLLAVSEFVVYEDTSFCFHIVAFLTIADNDNDMILFETGTFSFTGENLFYFSLVRQFPNDEDEYYRATEVAAMGNAYYEVQRNLPSQ